MQQTGFGTFFFAPGMQAEWVITPICAPKVFLGSPDDLQAGLARACSEQQER